MSKLVEKLRDATDKVEELEQDCELMRDALAKLARANGRWLVSSSPIEDLIEGSLRGVGEECEDGKREPVEPKDRRDR